MFKETAISAALALISGCTTITIKVPTHNEAYEQGCIDAGGTEKECLEHMRERELTTIEDI